MSAEVIWTLLLSAAGIVAAVAISVWQVRSGEQRKKSLPPKNEVTLFALRALVAKQNRSPDPKAVLTYDDLYKHIVDDWNDSSSDGNFDPSAKNKRLHAYAQDSIKVLLNPESRLAPLIVQEGGAYSVTPQGHDLYQKLPTAERSERARELNEYLTGSLDLHTNKPSGSAAQTAAPHAIKRPSTPREWRYAVFMEVPEGEALERDALIRLIGQRLSPRGFGRSAHTKVAGALQWNLDNGNLVSEADSRMRLVASKTDKTLDDFK